MRRVDALRLAAMTGVMLAAVVSAQQPPPRTTVEIAGLGPQVGTRVPGFSLPDHLGRTQTLESIMGAKGAMLVFFRSADW
jgi:hypothetical protein